MSDANSSKHASNFKDRTGMEYGELVVISYAGKKNTKKTTFWNCLCSCGKTIVVRGRNLLRQKNCGHDHCQKWMASITTHGKRRTPEYAIWSSIISRCFNKNNHAYRRYGGKGITMCPRWRSSFANFYEDMGSRPGKGLSIDRINNSKGYLCGKCEECTSSGEVKNCQWATGLEQGSNRNDNVRIEFRGRIQTLSQWARETGLHPVLISERLRRGWSPERILTEPPQTKDTRPDRVRVEFNGELKTLQEWGKELGIRWKTLYARLYSYGWSIDRAFKKTI